VAWKAVGCRKYAIVPACGTSVAAPLWAGLIVLADQYSGRHLGFVNPAHLPHRPRQLLPLGVPRHHHRHQHRQIPPRTVTGYRAAPGWNPVTGWGSPDARILVPLLARTAST
jgi:subtilase family serine protease